MVKYNHFTIQSALPKVYQVGIPEEQEGKSIINWTWEGCEEIASVAGIVLKNCYTIPDLMKSKPVEQHKRIKSIEVDIDVIFFHIFKGLKTNISIYNNLENLKSYFIEDCTVTAFSEEDAIMKIRLFEKIGYQGNTSTLYADFENAIIDYKIKKTTVEQYLFYWCTINLNLQHLIFRPKIQANPQNLRPFTIEEITRPTTTGVTFNTTWTIAGSN